MSVLAWIARKIGCPGCLKRATRTASADTRTAARKRFERLRDVKKQVR